MLSLFGVTVVVYFMKIFSGYRNYCAGKSTELPIMQYYEPVQITEPEQCHQTNQKKDDEPGALHQDY